VRAPRLSIPSAPADLEQRAHLLPCPQGQGPTESVLSIASARALQPLQHRIRADSAMRLQPPTAEPSPSRESICVGSLLDCIGQISQPMRSPNTSPLVAGRDQISLSPPSSEPHRKRASSEEHHRKRPSDQGAPIKNPMAIPPSDASDQGCPQMRRCLWVPAFSPFSHLTQLAPLTAVVSRPRICHPSPSSLFSWLRCTQDMQPFLLLSFILCAAALQDVYHAPLLCELF